MGLITTGLAVIHNYIFRVDIKNIRVDIKNKDLLAERHVIDRRFDHEEGGGAEEARG